MTTSTSPSRWRRARSWLLQLALIAAVLLAVQAWQTRNMASGPAPEASFQRATSPTVEQTLAQWRATHGGQPVVLYFWATWCTVCKVEQPMIDDLVRSHPVLPLALQSGPAATVAAYEQRSGLQWNSAVDTQGDIARAFGVHATPSFVVLDGDGRIASRTVGLTSPWGLRLRLWWTGLTG